MQVNPSGRRGFTLIELLVVIAIISLLLAIILPAFTKARDSAKRTQCATRLRSVFLSTSMYIGQEGRFPDMNNDADEGALQYNYLIFDGRDYEQNFGPLVRPNGPLQAIEVLFCPVQTDPFHSLRTRENHWRPKQNLDTRAGFGRRYGLSGKSLTDFRRIVSFAADVFHLDNLIQTAHKDGVNVVYTDGHAKWVTGIDDLLDNELSNPFDPADNEIVKDIWKKLDRKGR